MSEVVEKKRGLRTNFIFNFINQILALIVPFITTPYLARVLTEKGNGQYSYSLSIITYFILFANLGFEIYGQRQIATVRNDKIEKSKVFWEIFIFKSLLTLISASVLYSVLFSIGFGEAYNKIILVLSIQVIFIPFDIQYLYRGDENFVVIALRTIIMKIVTLVFIFVFVKTENDTWIYALCVAVSTAGSYFIMWLSVFKRIGFVKINNLNLIRHLKPMLLIFLPTVAVTIYSVFDKTMIGLLAVNSDYENGCYEQAYKLNNVALLLVTIISPVMISRNSYDYAHGNLETFERHLYKACNYVWLMGIPLIVGFAFLSENISSWFLGDGYEKVPLLLQMMSVRFIASGFGVIFGDQLFIVIGKLKYVTIASVVAAIANLVLNYFLIPPLGATGAAIATAICEVLVTLILCFFAVKLKYVSLIRITVLSWRYIVSAAIMGVVIFFIQKFLGYGILPFLIDAVAGASIYAVCLLILRDKFFIDNVNNVLGAIKAKVFHSKERDEGTTSKDENLIIENSEESDLNSKEDKNEQ